MKLCNHTAADRMVDGILATIESLEHHPESHPLVNEKLLSRVGVRMAWFENYNIFYLFEESKDIVHILRILYNRVDWHNELIRF